MSKGDAVRRADIEVSGMFSAGESSTGGPAAASASAMRASSAGGSAAGCRGDGGFSLAVLIVPLGELDELARGCVGGRFPVANRGGGGVGGRAGGWAGGPLTISDQGLAIAGGGRGAVSTATHEPEPEESCTGRTSAKASVSLSISSGFTARRRFGVAGSVSGCTSAMASAGTS